MPKIYPYTKEVNLTFGHMRFLDDFTRKNKMSYSEAIRFFIDYYMRIERRKEFEEHGKRTSRETT